MLRFIQSLEGRMLFTADATSLSTELAAVNASASAMKADVVAISAAVKTDLAAVTADLKGSAKTNAPLLRTLKADEGKWAARIKADVAALLKANTVATRGSADGNAVIKSPTNAAAISKITADITSLASAAGTPLAKLTADSSTATLSTDSAALTAANTTNATLATDANKNLADLNALAGTLLGHAAQYASNVGALKTDLTTLLPAPTTSPSLVGDYKGTLKTKGVIFGIGAKTVDFEILITSQTLDSVTGSITANGNTASGTITSKELSNGKLTLNINNSNFAVSLSGTVNVQATAAGLPPGSVIKGSGTVTINGNDIKGDFTVTKVT